MKIIHIVNSLNKGGAEGNLFRLCKLHKEEFKGDLDITVVTLLNKGFYEEELKKIGIKIFSLQIDREYISLSIFKKIFKLRAFIIKEKPDIIQSWMYHSNFVTLFMPRRFHQKIFWNIRHSELNSKYSKISTLLISIICGLLSNLVPKKIIYCSEKSINFHESRHFYSKKKTILIYNGCSSKDYYSSKHLRSNFRKKFKIQDSSIILGFAGRYSKQKNIYNLLLAFSKIVKKYNNVYLYMAGKDINYDNEGLKNYLIKLKLIEKVLLIDNQKSLVEFYNGIDLLILTSHSESFPNVLAESMLCSTPVLSSDAGCSKKIINNFGFILNMNDHVSIFSKIEKVIHIFINKKNFWRSLQINSRLHIKSNFSIKKMADLYLQKWNY